MMKRSLDFALLDLKKEEDKRDSLKTPAFDNDRLS